MYGLEKDIAKNLIRTYGERSFDIMKLTVQDPYLKDRLVSNHPFLNAEILYIYKYELVQDLSDILTRRIRLGFLDEKSLYQAVILGANIIQKSYGWNQVKREQFV